MGMKNKSDIEKYPELKTKLGVLDWTRIFVWFFCHIVAAEFNWNKKVGDKQLTEGKTGVSLELQDVGSQ